MNSTDKTLCLTTARVLEDWANAHRLLATPDARGADVSRAVSSCFFVAGQIRWALKDIEYADGAAT